MTKPIISIIIPTFNREQLIVDTLNSITNQTYENWECLVVDDGSIDSTKAVVNAYVEKDARFTFVERPEGSVKGAPTCRNIGLVQSKGDYVMFFDSDDILPSHILKTRIEFALNNSGYDFYVFQTIRFFDKLHLKDCVWNDLSQPNASDFKSFLSLNPIWHTSGPLWSKSFLINNKLFYTEGVSSWQDWEFHIRALLLSTNYLKSDDETSAALQRFHKSETINKNNTVVVTENRLELISLVVSAIQNQDSFKDKEVQLLVFKLYYFVISKLPLSSLKHGLWQNIQNRLYLVPKIDFWFWRRLLYFRKRNHHFFYKVIASFFIILKKGFFNKRFAIEDYSDRTWYKIKIKNTTNSSAQ
ncbi:glycosyltransferase family 2 protein [Psychroserpens damuponensis]|uniref:glycosyltransferase family 2 protein n=1 Tax=Psychroserpens damuponensis TaxID=943936 RepID=UPI000694C5B8|nr:glycosyltransferase family 2 protein [Psychroserpens damuponensis]